MADLIDRDKLLKDAQFSATVSGPRFTDPYGRKIFEGDILKITTPDYEYITKVYSEKNTLCVDVGNQEKVCTPIGLAVDIWNDECFNLKVIGNIYDNPELLEAEE